MVRLFAVVIALSLWAAPAALAGMGGLRPRPQRRLEAPSRSQRRRHFVVRETSRLPPPMAV